MWKIIFLDIPNQGLLSHISSTLIAFLLICFRDSFEKPDVNAMVVTNNEETSSSVLYAGCGDKQVHAFSLEDGKHIRSMVGHEDYIHSIQHQ